MRAPGTVCPLRGCPDCREVSGRLCRREWLARRALRGPLHPLKGTRWEGSRWDPGELRKAPPIADLVEQERFIHLPKDQQKCALHPCRAAGLACGFLIRLWFAKTRREPLQRAPPRLAQRKGEEDESASACFKPVLRYVPMELPGPRAPSDGTEGPLAHRGTPTMLDTLGTLRCLVRELVAV